MLATMPARPWDRKMVVLLATLSGVLCAITLPFAAVPWPALPTFVSAYEASLLINDSITAALLLGQFRELRRPALLVLGCGYLFTAAITVPHALSYPGLLQPEGLLGGSRTTAWVYMGWHGLFPGFVIGYALLSGRAGDAMIPPHRVARLTVLGIVGALALAGLCAGIAALCGDLLPALVDSRNQVQPAGHAIIAIAWLVTIAAGGILVRQTRLRRVLDLWLAMTMLAWALEILLGALLIRHRFDVGFYVGRAYGLVASSVILIMLLYQMIGLHARLARSVLVMRAQAEELVRSESALRQSQKLEAIGQLTGGVAHDFNNLLTGITGSLELLEREVDSPRGRRLLAVAQRSAWRGAKLTGQLLALSRKQQLVPEPLDLNLVVAGLRELLDSTLGGGVQVKTALQPGLWSALADRTQLELALLNLAINARDAMGGAGAITIVTANVATGPASEPEAPPAGEHVCLSVADCGHGIPAEVLPRVFEPYFTTKDVGRGSGLGLPQVLGVAKQLGGGVAIQTRPGHGTEVRVYLPRAHVAAVAEPDAPAAPASRLQGAAVLLVDDDHLVRATERAMLEDLGCTVIESDCGAAALDAAGSAVTLDLALIDFAMPGMSGVETARHIRALRPDLAIVFATGHAETMALDGARPAEIIAKPLRQAELAARLSVLLAQQRRAEALS